MHTYIHIYIYICICIEKDSFGLTSCACSSSLFYIQVILNDIDEALLPAPMRAPLVANMLAIHQMHEVRGPFSLSIYIYILYYICMYVYTVCIYIHICIYLHIYMNIHVYLNIYMSGYPSSPRCSPSTRCRRCVGLCTYFLVGSH